MASNGVIHVIDSDEAVRFFVENLGFTAVVHQPGYAYLDREGAGLRVMGHKDQPEEIGSPHGGFAYYIDVRDVGVVLEQIGDKLALLPQGHVRGPANLGDGLHRDGVAGASEAYDDRVGHLRQRVGDPFEAETTQGKIHFHDWIGDSWAVLFSHPKDFTPVCTTELGYMAKIKPEFDKRNTKVIGLSVDKVDNHEKWAKDIEETQGYAPNYPIIGDSDLKVSKLYGMLAGDAEGDVAVRTPADNQTVRNVFVIGPDKKIKLILVYPMTAGRNFDEVLRVIDSLQLTAKHKVATPVNWQRGDDVVIAGSVSDDQAREVWPEGWESPRPYIRIVPEPEKVPVG